MPLPLPARDERASGPFTIVDFVVDGGDIQILVPRRHPEGDRGDLVYTVSSYDARFQPPLAQVYRVL